ncbi:MAG: ComEC/Rec2 family competence protein, partial [Prolixibacteraceae bacterium]
MNKLFQKIPFLRLFLALTAGIIAAKWFIVPVLPALLILTGILFGLFLLQRFYNYRLTSWFGFAIHIFFIFLGITVYSLYNKKPVFHKNGNFLAIVLEAPVEKPNSYGSVVKIKSVIQNDSVFDTEEKMLVYFSKTEAAAQLNPGDCILFNQNPQLIENNGNPFEFNYKQYLAQKRIYRQVYLPEEDWLKTSPEHTFSLKVLSEQIRLKLLKIYRSQNFEKKELDVLSALTLGYKRELDTETRRVFSSAGAMHVLAVSGLHVGIIFLIIQFLFGFLKKRKTGRLVFVITALTIMWSFAFLTGLSPSVSRAATMFSFVIIGNNLNRQTNIYNSLAGSALFLLLINPNNLFEAGFQLSYSAVFGIVFIQPKLVRIATPPNKFLNYFWQLLTVSVAAQIATLPVTLFYFNQFPAYFWISNLFVIPAAFVLIPMGFSLLLFHNVPVLSEVISFITENLIRILYNLLQFIENLPFSVWQVALSPAELFFVGGLMISFFIFIEYRRTVYIKYVLVFVLFLAAASLYSKTAALFSRQIIVYNQSENTIIHLITGRKNYVVSQKPLSKEDYSFFNVNSTTHKLRLKKPVTLLIHQKFADESLVMDKEVLF